MIAFLLYILILAAAALPGLPAGWGLFGRRHPAGWVAGALVGYALTAFAIWLAIAAGFPAGFGFIAAWLLVTGASFAVTAIVVARATRPALEPFFPLPAWTRGDTVAYGLVLLLTILVAAPPFLRLGSYDEQGNRYYRAYFTADFVWHTALTAEVGKFSMPPRNPFLRNRTIHYYWTYFLVPAAVSSTGPAPVRDVERCLKLNAFFIGLLFVSAIFMSVRATGVSPAAAGIAVALALVASSAEGLVETLRLWREGTPLTALREANIDAISAWRWRGYRVDGLQRAIWYNPQHSMAAALGLVALAAAAARGVAPTAGAGLLVGVPLGASVAMNPFVGAMFSMAYGVGALVRASGEPSIVRAILRSSLAVAGVGAALAWCVGNEMVEGAGGVMDFGFHSISRFYPVTTLLLSLGPALVPALAGLFVRARMPFVSFVPAATLAGVSLFLMYYVRIAVDEYWMGFRTGHLMLVSLPALSARFFAWALANMKPAAVGVAALVLVAGGPTLLIDAYNAQDLNNFALSPGGFPWSRKVSPDEQAAWRWMREQTPPDAVIQQDSLSRHPNSWWVVPTFGQRRMAAAIPPFLMFEAEYQEKSERVRTIYATRSAEEAWTLARSLRIDYIYVDEIEQRAYGDALEKFNDPRYFSPAFQNSAVRVYRLR